MKENAEISLLIVFILLSVSGAVQLFYYYWFYLAFGIAKTPARENQKKPVSVIICARNEAMNLKRFLPSVLNQDYPDYEVIVVNDCSEDSSYEVLGELIPLYPHLRVSNITKDPKFTHNKKFAQFIGIKAAKNDILLFTDADCVPVSDKWIDGMASHFGESTKFVLGYGGYTRDNGLLNKYICCDTIFIAMQYMGMALRGIPYMGVGRNLAYRRSLFFSSKGYGIHNHLVSGDDDLFVNVNADAANTVVEFGTDTHTRSLTVNTVNEWFKQKKRHLSTAPHYRIRDILLLATEPFSRVLFFISAVILIFNLYAWPWVTGIITVRLLTQILVFRLAVKKLNEQSILFGLIIFDIFSPLINAIVYISNFFGRSDKNKWK